MSFGFSEIVLKNKFVIKWYEAILYTSMNWYLNEKKQNKSMRFSDVENGVFCLQVDSEASVLGFSARSWSDRLVPKQESHL